MRKWVKESSMLTRGQRKRMSRGKTGSIKSLQETKEYVKSEMGKWNDWKVCTEKNDKTNTEEK